MNELRKPGIVVAKNVDNDAGAGMAPAFRFPAVLSFSSVTYRYSADSPPALEGLDLELSPGQILAVVGGNGSGKTTLARLTNGLLLPEQGEVRVAGLSTKDGEHTWEVRSRVGLLFQNPDDQIVGASVEDDIAFGLENLGVAREEMRRIVPDMIGRVGLSGEESREPHLLSGGQRQRLALAAVLALQPSLLVLDEPTSMLDSAGRADILGYVSDLAREGLAVLLITQHMDETLLADRLLYLERGRAAYLGSPRDFFRSGRYLGTALGAPRALELARELPEPFSHVAPLDEGELAQVLEQWVRPDPSAPQVSGQSARRLPPKPQAQEPVLSLERVGLVYDKGLPFVREALCDIDLTVPQGSIVAVLGPTAAGKSTLLQVMGGLLKPTSGTLLMEGRDRPAPGEVGMVFQRPEVQLFAATVAEDVATAPRQQGLTGDLVEQRVRDALRLVGLEPETFGPRSPHRLSLGEQRRVALAGILSLEPRVLILDEPGAGLDPLGRRKLLQALVGWARAGRGDVKRSGHDFEQPQGRRTLVFTSHDLDEVAETADLVVVLLEGRVAGFGGRELLADDELLAKVGLVSPLVPRLGARLGLPTGERPVRARELAALLSGWSTAASPGEGAQ